MIKPALPLWEQEGPTRSFGFEMNQNRLAVPVWSYAMEMYRPERIIELGSYNGGFTIALAFAGWTNDVALYSFDQMEAPSEQWRAMARFLNVKFYRADIFKSEDFIKGLVQMEGPSFLLCDGGDKAKEFEIFSKHLKPGDIIAAHDYHTPYWYCGEIKLEHCEKIAGQEGLTRWNADLFEMAGWIAYAKSID